MISFSSSMLARRKGRYWWTCSRRKRCTPCTTRRSDPSGNLNILWMWVSVPTRKRSLSTGSSTAGSRWVITPMTLRSRTASCTSATELSRATARGRIACGKRMVSRRGRMARSVGTSARFSSVTPLDSKSGVRSSFSLISLSVARPEGRATAGGGTSDDGRQRAARCLGPLLRRQGLFPLLALDAQQGERHRLEARLRDVLPALVAGAVRSLVDALQGLVDADEGLGLHLHEGEVHLLREIGDA